MTVLHARTPAFPSALPAVVLLAGFATLYGPLYVELSRGLWLGDENAHAPLVLGIATWLLWQQRETLAALPDRPAFATGSTVLALGALLAAFGRALDIPLVAMASHVPVLAGILLLLRGPAALRHAAFPLAFVLFALPLPGIVIDAFTGSLKEAISIAAEEILYHLGYPVARSGVMLLIGQYRLLVADACSGLHSLLSLAALGLLFVHLRARGGRLHNALMIAAIVPIALAANLLRVLTLMLLTYHAGDAAAQWLHDATGVSLFLAALLLLIALDALLLRALAPRDETPAR